MMSSPAPLKSFDIKHFFNTPTIVSCRRLYHSVDTLCARSLDSSRRCQGLTFVSDEHCNFLFQIPVMATMRSTEAFPVWFILEKHIQLAPPFANCGFVHI
ncbi:unnamed protein product [Ixodes persulcatus]